MASIVEFACSPNSQIGNSAAEKGVSSVRLCKEICDLTTEEGLKFAFESLRGLSHPIHLHGALPCTPWSKWNVYNQHKLGRKFKEKIDGDKITSLKMLSNF